MESIDKAIRKAKARGNTVVYYAIFNAKDWFEKISFPVIASDFVVCQWSDFHDGEKSNIEGKVTIAICRRYDDAVLIYESRLKTQK